MLSDEFIADTSIRPGGIRGFIQFGKESARLKFHQHVVNRLQLDRRGFIEPLIDEGPQFHRVDR